MSTSEALLPVLVALLVAACPGRANTEPLPVDFHPRELDRPLDAAVTDAMLPRFKHLFDEVVEHGLQLEIDGISVFNGRDSILLIGEICQRFIETGMEATPQLREWLRKAVDVILVGPNPAGEGFQFGRSIGAYGDGAYLEVLTAAAFLDVLTPEEKAMAHAFHVRAAARCVEFWYDAGMQSVNLWEHGRRTDAYRGKHRILGENLSLLHQHVYTSKLWARLGFAGQPPDPGFIAWLGNLPRFTLTWFARGEYDRALLAFSDGLRVIQLPLINGGRSQHMHNPYFPIPFSRALFQGSADAGFSQFLPRRPLENVRIEMEFASFSRDARRDGERVVFGRGAAREFAAAGLDDIEVDPVADDPIYRAPTGQMQTRIRCTATLTKMNQPLLLSWTVRWE